MLVFILVEKAQDIYLTEQAVSNLSLVGSMMIFCVGVNILWESKFRVADMLPALVVAVVWAAF